MEKKLNLAVVSLIVGVVSFLQLFGTEKAILAIVFGAFALKQSVIEADRKSRNFAIAGIAAGSAYILVVLFFLATKGPQMMDFITKLKGFK